MKKQGIRRFPSKLPTRLARLTVFTLTSLLLLAACNRQEAPEARSQPASDSRTIKIGLIPEQDIFVQKKRYEPLLAQLAKELHRPIEIRMLPRYGNIIENFRELDLDGAFLGSFTGTLAIGELGVEPLARPLYSDGSSTYYGMIFVRRGSGLHSARDLRSKRLVLVDKATTAGYLLPLAYFKSLGIADYRTWFREVYFSGNHEDAIRDVLSGDADIGAAKNTIFYQVAKADPRVLRELDILAVSPHVPTNGLMVRSELPDLLKQTLKQKLLTMHETPEGRKILGDMQIARFIETRAEDYRPVSDYAAGIGLDLKNYDYHNN
ncbi:MAG: phosphate/phosphite/phosphonate ABC transporter substrate-binding protein [Desulfuromonas sp.]|nr:phosphate/phosphite/phosphonate ABC transporter substrate-binding protein [Desulfuromonas sp.]